MARTKIPMVGRRYGSVLVLAEAGWRHFPRGGMARMVRVRCDCGREYITGAQPLRVGMATRCESCRNSALGAAATAKSVRLPDGVSIAEIAALTGLKLDTVYHRHIRGWPRHRLGEATQRRRA